MLMTAQERGCRQIAARAHVVEDSHQLGTHICARPLRLPRALWGDNDHGCITAATEQSGLKLQCLGEAGAEMYPIGCATAASTMKIQEQGCC